MTSLLTIVILFAIWQLFLNTPVAEEPTFETPCPHCGYKLTKEDGPCDGNCEIVEVRLRRRKKG